MANSKEFCNAASYVDKLKQSPTENELLELYKYYKQATIGDINIPKPGLFYIRQIRKWDAWNSVKGDDTHTSEVNYINLVNILISKYEIN